MANIPDELVLKRHRDLEGLTWTVWIRRASLLLLLAVSVLGFFNVFGQRPTTRLVETPDASLKVYAPTRLRGGLLYMARFTIRAHRDLQKATLILDPGWAESITINTIEPSPVGEASDDGRLSFDLGHIPAGKVFRLFMDFQVNPTNVGSRDQDVVLKDDDSTIAVVSRSAFVFP